MAKRVTRAAALAAVKRAWPKAGIRTNLKAPTKEKREQANKERMASIAARQTNDLAMKQLGNVYDRLYAAVSNVLHAESGPAEITAMEVAHRECTRYRELQADNSKRRKHEATLDTHSYRYEAVELFNNGLPCAMVHAWADTLEELVDKAEAEIAKRVARLKK